MEQSHVRRFRETETGREYEDQQVADDQRAEQARERGSEITAEMDEILDEIDEVLEKDAYDFVRGFVQKGGE